ncbi:MAG: hypothetical protein IT185_09155, partial [Acidobacteria bacterium]|nr:hypothetical protein [Acidobacteriota bacterium]
HDPDRPEDVDTDGEDHAPDALRYGCMSRPSVRKVPENEPGRLLAVGSLNQVRMDDLWPAEGKRNRPRL